jgi:NAD+ kinase
MDHPVIGLTANITKPGAPALARQLAAQFREAGARLLCESMTAAAAGLPDGLPLLEVARAVDMLVVLGGDGTILHTARQLGAEVRPLAAVNVGRLGFLTTATTTEMTTFVRALLKGEVTVTRRRTVQACFTDHEGGSHCLTGLNEAVVSRGAASRMIRLSVTINGTFVNTYSCDGLIVSTPTGSTAYSLSAGGPIIYPEAQVFCISPICPHAVANRSLVVNDDAEIVLNPVATAEELLLSMDGGAPVMLSREAPVVLSRGLWTVPLVSLPGASFFGVLRQKLQWNGGAV